MPERDAGEWLRPHAPLSRLVARMVGDSRLPRLFWWPDPVGEFHRVTTAAGGSGVVVIETVAEPPGGLSAREAQVLAMVMTGRTNQQIGRALFIAPATVAKHLSRIFTKLGVPGRAGAVNKAAALGFVPLD
ncbi:LuxR family transcriptional regulator [Pseudonocardiaceae bacterium YIM PH 21723]|nr:LuxR family transcriptional regulator [Pseudonocardiaceae bacterium YIM PH 21723]